MYRFVAPGGPNAAKPQPSLKPFEMVNQAMTAQAGFANGKIYADMSGPFDTVIWQFEAESLDRFYQAERGVFVN